MAQTAIIDLSHLRLFTLGDLDTEKMMLHEILTEISSEVVKMRELTTEKKWYELSRVAHKLKTTLPFIGNQELIELNQKIEHASRNETGLEEVPGEVLKFEKILPDVIKALEEAISE